MTEDKYTQPAKTDETKFKRAIPERPKAITTTIYDGGGGSGSGAIIGIPLVLLIIAVVIRLYG